MMEKLTWLKYTLRGITWKSLKASDIRYYEISRRTKVISPKVKKLAARSIFLKIGPLLHVWDVLLWTLFNSAAASASSSYHPDGRSFFTSSSLGWQSPSWRWSGAPPGPWLWNLTFEFNFYTLGKLCRNSPHESVSHGQAEGADDGALKKYFFCSLNYFILKLGKRACHPYLHSETGVNQVDGQLLTYTEKTKNTPIYLGAQSVRVSANVAMSLSQTGRGNVFFRTRQ